MSYMKYQVDDIFGIPDSGIMTDRGETGTTRFSLTGFFSKGSHLNGMIFAPMEEMCKVCQISKENINFPESYEQKEFEKDIRVNGF